MKLTFITVCISFLHLVSFCYTHPLEQRIVEIVDPERELVFLEIDNIKDPSKRKPRQEDGGVDAGEAAEGLETTAQIGSNVIKVVTSALTGNVNGIFDGSFNLFGTGSTRNQVEGFFQQLVGGLVNSIVGPTTVNPNKGSSESSGTGSDSAAASNVVAAPTTVKAPQAQYVILLNQNGGQIKGAQIISPQGQNIIANPKPAAAVTVRATTKKAEEDDDEEENEENSGRHNNNNSNNNNKFTIQ